MPIIQVFERFMVVFLKTSSLHTPLFNPDFPLLPNYGISGHSF